MKAWGIKDTRNGVRNSTKSLLKQAKNVEYEAETVVGITDVGEYVLYDVVDMEPTDFKLKEEPSTAATGKKTDSTIQESSSAVIAKADSSAMTAPQLSVDTANESASENSILSNDKDVNSNSVDNAEYTVLAQVHSKVRYEK